MYRESETVGCSAQWGLYIAPLLSRLGDLCGKGAAAKVRGTLSEPVVVAGTVSSGHKMFELIETMPEHAGQTRVQTNSIPAWRRGSGHKVLPLTKKLFTTDASWEREAILQCSVTLPRRSRAWGYSANTKWTLCFWCYFDFVFLKQKKYNWLDIEKIEGELEEKKEYERNMKFSKNKWKH